MSCKREIPNETALLAKPDISVKKLCALSIDSLGAFISPNKSVNGSAITAKLGSSLRYLFASFTNNGMKIKRNNVASKTAVKKVINTLNLSGTPIFVK